MFAGISEVSELKVSIIINPMTTMPISANAPAITIWVRRRNQNRFKVVGAFGAPVNHNIQSRKIAAIGTAATIR